MQWQIGNVRITEIVELPAVASPMMATVVPSLVPENLSQMPWLKPEFVDDNHIPIAGIHTLVVESRGALIVVDTGIGNGKESVSPDWAHLDSPFLTTFADAGFDPANVNVVFSTHLHLDHVGWNTMLVDRKWVPTFPHAEYLWGKSEWKHWTEIEPEGLAVGPVVMEQSLLPIVDAGLSVLVGEGHAITDEVWLEPSPGHTPGHMSVHIKSEGEEAILVGDTVHHPAQFTHPEWIDGFDSNSELAEASRLALGERTANTPIVVIGGHFGAGVMVSDNGEFHFQSLST